MKKIVIFNHYSANKGNLSLLYTLVENIKTEVPDSSVEVSSFNPGDTEEMFGYRAFEWPFIFRKIANARGVSRIFFALYELTLSLLPVIISLMVRIRLLKPEKLRGRLLIVRKIYESDICVVPGGHLFTNLNHFTGIYCYFLSCLLTRILGRKYVVIGQSLGPFFGFFRYFTVLLTRYVVSRASYVSVRDEASFNRLRRNGIDTDGIAKTSEIVFMFPLKDIKDYEMELDINRDNPTLGITIHHLYYKRWMSTEDYVNRVSSFIDMVKRKFNYNVLFISMEKERKKKSDVPLIKSIISELEDSDGVSIAQSPNIDPRYTLNLIQKIDYLYATKTHSVAFGLLSAIPTLAISYDQKTRDFMKEFDLESYCINLKDFTSEKGFDTFSEIVRNSESIKNDIISNLDTVRELAKRNVRILNEL